MKLSIFCQAKASLFLLIGCMLFLIHPQASFADQKVLEETIESTAEIKRNTEVVLSDGNGKYTVNDWVKSPLDSFTIVED